MKNEKFFGDLGEEYANKGVKMKWSKEIDDEMKSGSEEKKMSGGASQRRKKGSSCSFFNINFVSKP